MSWILKYPKVKMAAFSVQMHIQVGKNDRTDEEIQEIQDKINHKPRKILGYRIPYEVYHNINLKYIT